MASFNLDLVSNQLFHLFQEQPNRDRNPLLAQVPSGPILTGVNPD